MKSKCIIWDSFFFGLILALGLLFMLDRKSNEGQIGAKIAGSEINVTKSFPVNNEPQEIVKASIPTGNIPSSIHVEVSRETLCLFTILFTDCKLSFEQYRPKIPIPLQKHFITLFRSVISPNAP